MKFRLIFFLVSIATLLPVVPPTFAQTVVPSTKKFVESKAKTASKQANELATYVSGYGQGTITTEAFLRWIGDATPPELSDAVRNADQRWLLQTDVNSGATTNPGDRTICHINFTMRLWPTDRTIRASLSSSTLKLPFYGSNSYVVNPAVGQCEQLMKERLGVALREMTSQFQRLPSK